MTPATVGAGGGGKQIHGSQAEAPGLSSAVVMPKKAKLLESMGAQPKTIAQDTFTSGCSPACHTSSRAPASTSGTQSTEGSPWMGKMVCGLLLGPHQWGFPLWATKLQSVCLVHYWELSVVMVATWDLSAQMR